jgi:hypothetical protein
MAIARILRPKQPVRAKARFEGVCTIHNFLHLQHFHAVLNEAEHARRLLQPEQSDYAYSRLAARLDPANELGASEPPSLARTILGSNETLSTVRNATGRRKLLLSDFPVETRLYKSSSVCFRSMTSYIYGWCGYVIHSVLKLLFTILAGNGVAHR